MPVVLNHGMRKAITFGRMQAFGVTSSEYEERVIALRRMVWVYFALLIAEGALRKWVIPSLSGPLLIIRDPLVLLIYVQALRCRKFPINGPMVSYFLLLISFILLAAFQIVSDIGGGPLVAAYGLRTNFLHLPLIFVIPQVFSYEDVIKLGRWVLMISVPMSALMVWQFMSSPDSLINAATLPERQQLESALGRIRPAGTFSFATGSAHFFTLAATFLVFGLMRPRAGYSRWLLGAALISIAVVQPVSGSRLLVLGSALAVVAALVFVIVRREQINRILLIVVAVCTVLAVFSLTSFFRDAITVFMTRWDEASGGSAIESVTGRILEAFLGPLDVGSEVGLFGLGIGLGTNVGSALATGTARFLLAEGEWARVIMEAGPLLGLSFLVYRAWVAGDVAVRALVGVKQQPLLVWLLAWAACPSLLIEQISQTTNLGFMVLMSGLCLAAMSPSPSTAAAPSLVSNSLAGTRLRLGNSSFR
jgi:hypothetical protein